MLEWEELGVKRSGNVRMGGASCEGEWQCWNGRSLV